MDEHFFLVPSIGAIYGDKFLFMHSPADLPTLKYFWHIKVLLLNFFYALLTDFQKQHNTT